jgi:predicted 3-demethylubiquinone-9 3-methyltransferase (glyoxalase superfamily)
MLWFDDQAAQAAEHYVAVFNGSPGRQGGSRIVETSHYGEAGPGKPGSVMVVAFELDGQPFTALNGGPAEYHFSEAISFVVNCADQAQVDYFWSALSSGGEEGPCGWLKDRFGLSWQVVPVGMQRMLSDPDQAAAQRAMKAMLQMHKLDLGALERAFAG